jgi:N-hydroxyarylamine O-acetyltransferase
MLDLDAYFARIGYGGPRSPTLAVLRAIHALHPASIPFENIDPLLARPVPLNLAALQAKMIGSRRGGYCFEQNTLFRSVLEQLGFAVTGLAARVVWRMPPAAPPNPRAHMVLRVDLDDGPWLADVGFGGFLFAEPLRLAPGIEQSTASGPFRLVRDEVAYTLQRWCSAGWADVYRFTLEPQVPIDFEVANWFTSTHPASRFRNNLLIERLTPGLRVSVFNARLTRRHTDGRVEEAILDSPDRLAQALVADFGLELAADPALLFGRLPSA